MILKPVLCKDIPGQWDHERKGMGFSWRFQVPDTANPCLSLSSSSSLPGGYLFGCLSAAVWESGFQG